MANTYNTDLSTNNALLEAILSVINSLPENEATEIVLQSKTVTPSGTAQTITPDSGYNGLSYVIVKTDSNLKAENIKNGTTIFGVTGTYIPVFA